ncbi:ATP-binding protein [Mycoplasma sp. Ms02]|uniref:ATP-binding protein n=1 Tax=Mycoplasma sp. Ms02 TaxID=353851 RepID=UPI001C8995BB|nr:ATP-binding protein [Mycoplasma sp. Ms02]QZE12191.1 AAA family ATPase [Mycoplasma sp. Ms02]
MKIKDILELIRYHVEEDERGFRQQAYKFAEHFDKQGNDEVANYIYYIFSGAPGLTSQDMPDLEFNFLKVIPNGERKSLPLPEETAQEIKGIINAVNHNAGVNKFLFKGTPGTGKTETVKQIARILQKKLFIVNFESLIDSKLGQTGQNINKLFEEINSIPNPENVLILFDEIDALALDRTNSNDLREMGRATTTVLKNFDSVNEKVTIVATTNLYDYFDKALVRRFDAVIDFDKYTKEDLIEVSEKILEIHLSKFKKAGKNIRLFRKILTNIKKLPMPGDLNNLIKTSLAFSNPEQEYEYLKILHAKLNEDKKLSASDLSNLGYTLREIEVLTGVPKSTVGREILQNRKQLT